MSDAQAWYESHRIGLGDEFLAAVDDTLSSILDAPMRYRVLVLDTRQALVRRFPYRVSIASQVMKSSWWPVFHASRDPRTWDSRR